jgi:hypothetical protein
VNQSEVDGIAQPVLTVVLIAGNNRHRAQRVLRSVLEQDIAEQIVIMVSITRTNHHPICLS